MTRVVLYNMTMEHGTRSQTPQEAEAMTERPSYVETDCTFTHDGQAFESGGAVVTPDSCVAYPKPGGVLGDWHGRDIGTWRAVATWRTPRSFYSSSMSQIEATVDGVTYTGRGAGVGMIFKGRRKARKGGAR